MIVNSSLILLLNTGNCNRFYVLGWLSTLSFWINPHALPKKYSIIHRIFIKNNRELNGYLIKLFKFLSYLKMCLSNVLKLLIELFFILFNLKFIVILILWRNVHYCNIKRFNVRQITNNNLFKYLNNGTMEIWCEQGVEKTYIGIIRNIY